MRRPRIFGRALSNRQMWFLVVAGALAVATILAIGVVAVVAAIDARRTAEARAGQALALAQSTSMSADQRGALAARRIDLLNRETANLEAEIAQLVAAHGDQAAIQQALTAAEDRQRAIDTQTAASTPAGPPPVTTVPPTTTTTRPPSTTSTTQPPAPCVAAVNGRCLIR